MTWRVRERRVARDDRRVKRLRQSDVHGVVRRHVLAQLPRSSQKIEMGVTVEVEVDSQLRKSSSAASQSPVVYSGHIGDGSFRRPST